ncbi:MAG: hypothetical protein IJQ41_04570 [Firmicutes bacterium]|nr:hypothetical protein [Bacillota bacterium]MBQ4409351.1 hypothetical protein [Bacillota bacterium]MBR0210000.1 hypothetical protein [Bacillota bacterium]MBR0517863.1 hypothetical protein [Bacillota bacterium]
MDWSKAKNIIIAVLLAANVLIGGNLLAQHSREQAQARQATENAYAFLEQAGMQVDAQLPDQEKKLPVLFLRLHKAGEELTEVRYKDYPIVVQGSGIGYEIAGTGQQAAPTIPAAEALLKLYAQLSAEGSVKGKRVESVELVYLLSPDEASYAAQDTASPAWQIRVDGRTYYVDAYGE